MSERVTNILVGVFWALIIGGMLFGGNIYNHFKVSCANEAIAFSKTSIEDAGYSYNFVKTDGVQGSREVCTRGNGTQVSSRITTNPVTEVSVVGTKPLERFVIPPRIEPEDHTYGSICNDGTWSPSTGRGTCSWHSGVAYVL